MNTIKCPLKKKKRILKLWTHYHQQSVVISVLLQHCYIHIYDDTSQYLPKTVLYFCNSLHVNIESVDSVFFSVKRVANHCRISQIPVRVFSADKQ